MAYVDMMIYRTSMFNRVSVLGRALQNFASVYLGCINDIYLCISRVLYIYHMYDEENITLNMKQVYSQLIGWTLLLLIFPEDR